MNNKRPIYGVFQKETNNILAVYSSKAIALQYIVDSKNINLEVKKIEFGVYIK